MTLRHHLITPSAASQRFLNSLQLMARVSPSRGSCQLPRRIVDIRITKLPLLYQSLHQSPSTAGKSLARKQGQRFLSQQESVQRTMMRWHPLISAYGRIKWYLPSRFRFRDRATLRQGINIRDPLGQILPSQAAESRYREVSYVSTTKGSLFNEFACPKLVASHEMPTGKSLGAHAAGTLTSSMISHAQTVYNGRETALRNKASTLSANSSYLAPPHTGSDLSATRSARWPPSASPSRRSPRSSMERDRVPSATYHVVAGHGSEATDSANSSLVSEPRSAVRPPEPASTLFATTPNHNKQKGARPDTNAKSLSNSPEMVLANDDTPRPHPQIVRLETTMAPKFHIEQRAGGEFAPSPTKSRFATKIGKLFNNK